MSLTSQSTSEESSTSPYRIRPPGQSSSQNPKLDIIIEQVSNRDSEDQHFLRSSLEDTPLKAASLLGLGSPTAIVPSSKEKKFRLRKTKGTEYESDGGYMSEGSKKAKKTSRWRRKDAADGYESDGRNLSEANSSKTSKDKKNIEDSASPLSDPGAFLATVNASLLPQSPQPDGYVTDSATASTERGRSKKKEKSRTQLSSPHQR
ncbi:hypothetical protein DFH11DRAFT_360141 [Phellopilus nigrolimitatus]|nr:hypothetical protein DFH11DRAFT_360141 [Phellopilus nigrolimitatus]